MESDLIILGAGGHARVVADACRSAGRTVRGFVSPQAPERPLPAPWLGDDSLLSSGALRDCELLVAIGSEADRARCGRVALDLGHRLATIVHPSAVVATSVAIGPGAVVFAGAVINPDCTIGALSVVNTSASIDHDCVLGDCAQVGPGAVLGGTVQLEERAFVGIGSVVLPGVRIGAGAVVGGGAVVTRDVAPSTTVVGIPARPL